MSEEKESGFERKMQMMKMRDEMLNAMSDKELRAFIKGYMIAERTAFKHMMAMNSCQCGCGEGSSCACGKENCNCGKE